jgi:hypothetical protein
MNWRSFAATVCAGAWICSLVGCGNSSTVKPADTSDGSVQQEAASVVTTTTVPLTTQIGVVGEEAGIGGVEVTINQLLRSDYHGAQDDVLTDVVFLNVTVTNNTDSAIDANMMTSFEFDVDGEAYNTATLFAISSTRKQFGDDVNLMTDQIEAGATQTGYIAAEVPSDFETLTLYCLPLGGAGENYDVSQAICYTLLAEDFEAI